MSDYIRKNVKYLFILSLCLILIFLNTYKLLNKPKEILTVKTGYLNYSKYYDEKIPSFKIKTDKSVLKIPDNNNILIIGLNREVNTSIRHLESLFKKINLNDYDIEVIVITRAKKYKKSRYLKICNYVCIDFDKFFQLEEQYKYTLLVNKKGKIKHFMRRLIELDNIKSLLLRYKKG